MFDIKALHDNQYLVDDCVKLLNDEWPRSKAARLHSVSKSCPTLPYSLVLVENGNTVVGYCRLAKVISDANSVLVESVVVDKKRRGQGLGRIVMEMAEQHAAGAGIKKMYLCTKDKQGFYEHLGYSYCQPVNTLGAQMLETCNCAPEMNVPLEENGSGSCCTSKCSSSCSTSCGASTPDQSSAKDNQDSCCKEGSCESATCAGKDSSKESCSASNCVPPSDPSLSATPSSPAPPPPVPPPPPPTLPSAAKPAQRIDWMMKVLA